MNDASTVNAKLAASNLNLAALRYARVFFNSSQSTEEVENDLRLAAVAFTHEYNKHGFYKELNPPEMTAVL